MYEFVHFIKKISIKIFICTYIHILIKIIYQISFDMHYSYPDVFYAERKYILRYKDNLCNSIF